MTIDSVLHDQELKEIISACESYGIIFNFKNEHGHIKTGIIRRHGYYESIFSNNWLPEKWRKMTREERRKL
jgi:hypothetical protein